MDRLIAFLDVLAWLGIIWCIFLFYVRWYLLYWQEHTFDNRVQALGMQAKGQKYSSLKLYAVLWGMCLTWIIARLR